MNNLYIPFHILSLMPEQWPEPDEDEPTLQPRDLGLPLRSRDALTEDE